MLENVRDPAYDPEIHITQAELWCPRCEKFTIIRGVEGVNPVKVITCNCGQQYTLSVDVYP
jgi:hypothetical protein